MISYILCGVYFVILCLVWIMVCCFVGCVLLLYSVYFGESDPKCLLKGSDVAGLVLSMG